METGSFRHFRLWVNIVLRPYLGGKAARSSGASLCIQRDIELAEVHERLRELFMQKYKRMRFFAKLEFGESSF